MRTKLEMDWDRYPKKDNQQNTVNNYPACVCVCLNVKRDETYYRKIEGIYTYAISFSAASSALMSSSAE
jgi:hypothetical protein